MTDTHDFTCLKNNSIHNDKNRSMHVSHASDTIYNSDLDHCCYNTLQHRCRHVCPNTLSVSTRFLTLFVFLSFHAVHKIFIKTLTGTCVGYYTLPIHARICFLTRFPLFVLKNSRKNDHIRR